MTTPDSSLPASGVAETEKPTGKTTHYTLLRALVHFRTWWRETVIEDVDQDACIEGIRGESLFTSRYVFMTCMSAGIAMLGLLLSSPAVVIGAMLLSPLMSPIIGAGFALATGDFIWLRRCGRALLYGSIIAILFCAVIVFLSPLQTVTEEIAARTRPNLFDLLVALFSGLAGTYAVIRGQAGTIVGVAIATALMPPLAVIGFGLATFNWAAFGGATMLFVTNLITIALIAALMARLYGFHTRLTETQTRLQNLGIVFTFIALGVPLLLSLQTITFETRASAQIRAAIEEAFVEEARIDHLDIAFSSEPIRIDASVLTPTFERQAESRIARRLERSLDRALVVEIDQFQVGTDPGAAEQAQLERASAEQAARASAAKIRSLAERLALVAGVPVSEVTIDRDNRRALADARTLPGLSWQGYRTLERRTAADMEGWDVRLRPPMAPLPEIVLEEDGSLGEVGRARLSLVEWAALRLRLPVVLDGEGEALASAASELRNAGIAVTTRETGPTGKIAVSWQTTGTVE